MLLKFIIRLVCCLAVLLCQTSQAESIAQRSILAEEPLIFLQAERVDVDAEGAFSQSVNAKLPESWNAIEKSGRSNYLLTFDIANPANARPLAMYVPRLGNRFSVLLNGKKIAESAPFGDALSDSSRKPFFLKLPTELLLGHSNVVELQIEGEKNRYAGLSKVHIGAEPAIHHRYSLRHGWQTAGSFAVMVACLMFAILSLFFWRVTKDNSYVLFTLLCALWSLRTSYAVVLQAPFDYHWWSFLLDMSYAGVVCCVMLFCIRTLNLRFKKTLIFITGGFFMFSLVLVAWHSFGEVNAARQRWTFLMLAFVALLSIRVISEWYFYRQPGSAALAIAGALALILGAYDHVTVFYLKDGYGGFALTRYASLFYLSAMAWILADRFLRLLSHEKMLRREVAEELRDKKVVLEKELLEKEALISESAHHIERQRLLQDLHDGMGLQLNGLMGLVEHGSLNRGELTSEVRTTLEQLRVMMDGTESFDGTLAELFGHVRYRVETRLLRHGVELSWGCELSNTTEAKVNPTSALNLQRVMFELSTNIIKHAKASHVNVQIKVLEKSGIANELCVMVLDDGVGIPAFSSVNSANTHVLISGAGTLSVKRRIAELNARYELLPSLSKGVQHVLHIPISSFY